MTDDGGIDDKKRRAGESAAEIVEDDMTVGLGTGSTAAAAIRALGRRVDAGLDIVGIPTSYHSRHLAREVGIPLGTLEEATPDVAVDGADQVAARTLIKGGGGAHAREKIVDTAADRFVVVVDESKQTDTLALPIPLEVLPDAVPVIEQTLVELEGTPVIREATRKDGPVITDNGNLLIDCDFGPITDPHAIADKLANLPGVVEHGLFVDVADEIHIGVVDGVDVRRL